MCNSFKNLLNYYDYSFTSPFNKFINVKIDFYDNFTIFFDKIYLIIESGSVLGPIPPNINIKSLRSYEKGT